MSTEYGFITSGPGLNVYITGLIATTISTFYFSSRNKSAVLLLNNNTFFVLPQRNCFCQSSTNKNIVNSYY